MFTVGIYVLTGVFLLFSFLRDRQKTITALKKGWRALANILPIFLTIIPIMGFILAILTPEEIAAVMGTQSGWPGMILAAVMGSVMLIPGYITFPLAATLLKSGAGLMQTVTFISTSMMVGIVTIPVEQQYLGGKTAYLRNALALLFSFFVAAVLGEVLLCLRG